VFLSIKSRLNVHSLVAYSSVSLNRTKYNINVHHYLHLRGIFEPKSRKINTKTEYRNIRVAQLPACANRSSKEC
jgi:hypothetical protein